jgi:phage repressor protein C with HTH and peptisase S24 domain
MTSEILDLLGVYQEIGLPEHCVMDTKEIRHYNLLALQKNRFRGNTQLLAHAIEKDYNYTRGMLITPGEKGHRPIGEKMASHIEKALGLKDKSLDYQFMSKYVAAEPAQTYTINAPADGIVSIPEWHIEFSAGNGGANYEVDQLADPATYRLEWFAKERINPTDCKRFKVRGDSMESTLFDGDTILVNLGEQQIVDGKVYAIRYGNDLRVKRLYRRLDGTIVLRSDNPQYPEESVPPGDAQEQIAVIGRVRDKSGKGGL